MEIEEIKVGGKECVSGSFIASVNDVSEILVSRRKEKMRMTFLFKVKDIKKIVSSYSGGGKGKELKVNFELPLLEGQSQGILSPIQFAEFDNGDSVSLQLWIRKIANSYVVIDFSIYVESH